VRITDVHVDGFGVWSDLGIQELPAAMTVFHGPNEAGKTTLMQFIRTVLYGFSPERRERYLPPVQGGVAGGSLGVVTLGGRFRIQRRAPEIERGEHDAGDGQLIAADGSVQRGAVLENLLASVDESVFTNVFAIGLRELQELATLNDTEAAQQLYKLTSGMDRVSLVDVMFSLEKARSRIVGRDAKPALLDGLLAERDRLAAQVESLLQQGRRWARLASERRELDESAQKLEGAIWAAEHQGRVIEAANQVRERWLRMRAVEREIASLPESPEVSADALRRLDRLQEKIAERNKQIEAMRDARGALRDEDRAIPWNGALWENRSRLAALTEHAAWIDSLRKHAEQLHAEIDRLSGELKQTCQELGLTPNNVTPQSTRLDHRTMSALRGPARAAREAGRRAKQARTDRDNAARHAEEIATRLEFELAERGHPQLTGAIERSGELADRMRRRIQIEERLDKLIRHKKELDEDCLSLMQTPIMPLRQMIAWGSIVAFGVMLMMVSLFSDMVGENRIPIVFFGMMCTGGGFLLKHAYQQISGQELDECQRQLALTRKHVQQATAERDELDAALPQGSGPIENRLKKAEEDVRKLEQLAPLEQEHAVAQQRLEESDKRLAQTLAAQKDARQRWRSALKKLSLADDLTPEKVKHLADGHERLAAIQRQLHAKRKEKEERERDLHGLAQRIGDALRECGLTPESDDPRRQIRQMTDSVAEQQKHRDRRASLRNQDRTLRRKSERCARNVEKTALLRQAMFSRAGVENEVEFRRIGEFQDRGRRLDAERVDLDQQIRLASGMGCQWEEVDGELARNVDLRQLWREAADRQGELHAERDRLNQKRGENQQEMKSLLADRRLEQIQLELASVDERIARAKRDWRRLAVTGLVLERIRKVYESERQPETLNEASRFLAAFTEDRYRRIWTPLGKNALRVDDDQGRPLRVELLSQGTREAVFLSLRLALVAAYARRGADLPLVLDDVLVNLDSRRAAAAVRVLREFADGGHQVLLFTCHEHIADLFQAAGVETRELPIEKTRGLRIAARPVPEADPAERPRSHDSIPAAPETREAYEEPDDRDAPDACALADGPIIEEDWAESSTGTPTTAAIHASTDRAAEDAAPDPDAVDCVPVDSTNAEADTLDTGGVEEANESEAWETEDPIEDRRDASVRDRSRQDTATLPRRAARPRRVRRRESAKSGGWTKKDKRNPATWWDRD